jgi:hypothetical protein
MDCGERCGECAELLAGGDYDNYASGDYDGDYSNYASGDYDGDYSNYASGDGFSSSTAPPVQVSSWTELKSAIGAAVGPLSIDLAATFNCNYDSEIYISGSNKIITINGNGAVLDANTNGRLFYLEAGASLTLRSVTLQNGKVPHLCAIVLS